MMRARKILNIAALDLSIQQILSKELKISSILAQVLFNRGIHTPSQANKFLHPNLDGFLDPNSFKDMPLAVSIFKRAVKNKEKIMLCGDYDVDGVTSLALLKDVVTKAGLEPICYIPHRVKNGYGLNNEVVAIAKQNNIKVLITADCGISDYDQVKELRSSGIDVIITDHHEPLAKAALPLASAIINPKVKDSGYAFRDLAGVGVAYKFCQAVSSSVLEEELDLVALGTIADVVPLIGENRIIVREGLNRFANTKRAGIKALIEVSGIKNKKITTEFVGYILGPRINAGGRIDSAHAAFDLLVADNDLEAQRLAGVVNSYNRLRQKIEGKVMEEAQGLIDKEVNFKDHKVIVLAKEDWHQGVLGVVASKIADRFYRPAILISKDGAFCKGSGRSIRSFHLFDALCECKDYLDDFGGHKHAVGLVISKDNIDEFRERINRFAHECLRIEDLLPALDVDMELKLSDFSQDLADEIEMLEPFGCGNPAPLFFTRNLKIKGEPRVLSRDTLKFWVTDGAQTCSVIGFGMGSMADSLVSADSLDLVYTPKIDSWQGEEGLILHAEEIILNEAACVN